MPEIPADTARADQLEMIAKVNGGLYRSAEGEVGQLRAALARVIADCEEQSSRPITDDVYRGVWAQARRALGILRQAGVLEENTEEARTGDAHRET